MVMVMCSKLTGRAAIGLSGRLQAVHLGRRMFVLCAANRFGGGRMLRLLDARIVGGVFLVAQHQRDGEAFTMRRPVLAGQMVLVIDLGENGSKCVYIKKALRTKDI